MPLLLHLFLPALILSAESAFAFFHREKGGEVTGFLYFEKVDPDIRQVRFKAELFNASASDGEEPYATVSIPLTVIEK